MGPTVRKLVRLHDAAVKAARNLETAKVGTKNEGKLYDVWVKAESRFSLQLTAEIDGRL